jgi:hypothetical protein
MKLVILMLLLLLLLFFFFCRENSVCIAMSYELDGQVQFSAGTRDFSLFRSVQAGLEAHPASYPVGTGTSFTGVKAAGA